MGEPASARRMAAYQLAIVATACTIFFLPSLGWTGLWDMDEALYASCAREMFQRGDWVVPWFNGQLFPEKPPLMFWTMIGGFELFGVNEFGARFFSAVMGVGTALIAFHLGRLLFSARVGFWAGLITCSTIVFTVSARAATVDSALTFVTALAMLFFVLGLKRPGSEAQHPSSLILHPSGRPLRWPYAAGVYACVGLAVLAKGPVGMLLPLAAMGLYMLTANGWRNILRSAWQMRPITALLVIAAVALPWYIAVGVRTHGEWLRVFFVEFNLRPFRQPIQTHGDVGSLQHALAMLVTILYYFYHVPGILFGFFPWSVFLGPALVQTIRQIRRAQDADASNPKSQIPNQQIRLRDGCLLASCWFGVWFVFWSVCKTKLPHYLLPAYPALALLVACWIDRWLGEEEKKGTVPICRNGPPGASHKWGLSPFSPVPAWGPRNAWISTILAGVGIMIAVPIVAFYRLPGEGWLGLLGLVLVLGGGWCWWETAHGRRQRAAAAFALTAVVFLTATFGFAALRIDQHQNAKPMIAAIKADWEKKGSEPFSSAPIATYGLFRESTVFYAGHPVARCSDDPAKGQSARKLLEEFLARHAHQRCYVITSRSEDKEDDDEAKIDQAFPGVFEEIYRYPRFLELDGSEMVILRAGRRK